VLGLPISVLPIQNYDCYEFQAFLAGILLTRLASRS